MNRIPNRFGFRAGDERPPEDLAFERMMAATMAEAMAGARSGRGADAAGADRMATPAMLRRLDRPPAPPKAPGAPGMAFTMLKRGARGKLEARDLLVPSGTTLGAAVERNAAEVARQHKILKTATLYRAARID